MGAKPVRFLLVEDNDDHAELIVRALLAEDSIQSMVDRVRDGGEALLYLSRERAYEERGLPDIVLLDIRLEGGLSLDGLEVLATIKSDPGLRSMPVVILSSSHSPKDLSLAYERHANSYLCKPAGFGDFNLMIRSMARYWGLWNQGPGRAHA